VGSPSERWEHHCRDIAVRRSRRSRTPPVLFAIDEINELAAQVLGQDRYLARDYPTASETLLLGAFDPERCLGFLLFLVQIVGSDAGRPPVRVGEAVLTEGYVQAFGVAHADRRTGIGRLLQNTAIEYARRVGCYQMRSRSPISSSENYAMKLSMGYVLHPSDENDSYYFLLKL
jgi:GNAT superfamily N-acetyltransferase